jgi:cell division protease FtsH
MKRVTLLCVVGALLSASPGALAQGGPAHCTTPFKVGSKQRLVELDGFSATDNIVVIAASNLLEKLDPALLRPGRFDRQIFVTPPDLRGRRSILGVHTRDKPLTGNVDLEIIARQTSGLTGADLANLCNEAAIFAGRDHREEIGTKDFRPRWSA